jgi:hypothetical protein
MNGQGPRVVAMRQHDDRWRTRRSKSRNLNGGFDELHIDSWMSFLPSGPQHLRGNALGDFFDFVPRQRSFNWHLRLTSFANRHDVSKHVGRRDHCNQRGAIE